MSTARTSLLIFSGILLHYSSGMADEAAALRAAFAKSAPLDGDPYVVARQVLESQGEAIFPLLNEKARSADWREWSLAKALQIRMREPQQAARWRWAIRNWQRDLQVDAQGRLVTTLSDKIVKAAALQGETLTPGEVELGREALPIVIDSLRETTLSAGNSERILAQSLMALKHWRDPKAVGPILNSYRMSDDVVETLAAFGQPALPELHAALETANAPWPKHLQASLAAKVLGKIGNETSARLLIQTLPEIPTDGIRADFCQAIGRLKPLEGPDVLFHELQRLAFDRRDNRRDLDQATYLKVRSELLEFGAVAKPALDSYLRPGVSVETRALAAGILHELSHPNEMTALYQQTGEQWILRQGERDEELTPEDIVLRGRRLFWARVYSHVDFLRPALLEKVPAPLLIEIAVITREEPLIERLSFLKDHELAMEALKWLLSSDQSSWAARRAAILPLAEVAGVKAIPALREFLKEHPLQELERLVEAAILIGDPQAGELLDALLEHPDALRRFETDLRQKRATIQSIAQVLKQRPNDLAKLLELDDPAFRLAAAQVLAKKGDPRCVGLLFAVIVESAGGEAREANLRIAHQAQKAIVRMGRPALESIEKAAEASNAKYADLLAEVLKLRITQPALDQKVQNAMHRPWFGWGKRSGPSLADVQFAGRQVAKLAGKEAIPLLEAMIVWAGNPSPTHVAFALAEFERDRSLEIVVAHASQIRWAGAVLQEFGEKGIAAAKTVPVPDPDRPRFASRRGRHREATTALAGAGDAEGVEGILAGLQLAAEGKIPPEQTSAYLQLAAKYKDERLIPAVVAAVTKQGTAIARSALQAVHAYQDERLVPIYLQFLGELPSTGDFALQGIARIQGEDTVPFLLKQLEDTRDDASRLGIIHSLAKLRPDSRLFVETKLTQANLQDHASSVRDALIKQLRAKEKSVQMKAAESLAMVVEGRRDKPAIEALVHWMAQQDQWPWAVVNYVVWTEEPSIAPALLRLYRKAPLKRTRLAEYFAAIKYQPALDDVATALQNRIEQNETQWGLPEVKLLARFGEAGRDKLWELLKQSRNLGLRVATFQALSQFGNDRVFEPAAELFHQLIQNGLWDPELRPRNHGERLQTYIYYLNSLAESLTRLDARRAYPLLARACLEVDEAAAQRDLAGRICQTLQQHPEYRREKVSLDPITPISIEGNAEVPLLKACELWHEVVTRHYGKMPAEVRERLIATGEDALQVGVELFYDWPVPGIREIEQAVAHLTHEEASLRREATALLAVRKYSAKDLDEALANAKGENLARGNAIRRWRETGGKLLDADLTERGEWTNLLLLDWPIDHLRKFTIGNLDRLTSISNEAYIWSQKPLFPMLLSVRYSPKESERVLIKAFTKKASPEAKNVSSQVELRGVGVDGISVDRWGALPPLP